MLSGLYPYRGGVLRGFSGVIGRRRFARMEGARGRSGGGWGNLRAVSEIPIGRAGTWRRPGLIADVRLKHAQNLFCARVKLYEPGPREVDSMFRPSFLNRYKRAKMRTRFSIQNRASCAHSFSKSKHFILKPHIPRRGKTQIRFTKVSSTHKSDSAPRWA